MRLDGTRIARLSLPLVISLAVTSMLRFQLVRDFRFRTSIVPARLTSSPRGTRKDLAYTVCKGQAVYNISFISLGPLPEYLFKFFFCVLGTLSMDSADGGGVSGDPCFGSRRPFPPLTPLLFLRWGRSAGLGVVVCSSDKDMCQLVRDRVHVMQPRRYVCMVLLSMLLGSCTA